jgi:hypothetical protein
MDNGAEIVMDTDTDTDMELGLHMDMHGHRHGWLDMPQVQFVFYAERETHYR